MMQTATALAMHLPQPPRLPFGRVAKPSIVRPGSARAQRITSVRSLRNFDWPEVKDGFRHWHTCMYVQEHQLDCSLILYTVAVSRHSKSATCKKGLIFSLLSNVHDVVEASPSTAVHLQPATCMRIVHLRTIPASACRLFYSTATAFWSTQKRTDIGSLSIGRLSRRVGDEPAYAKIYR